MIKVFVPILFAVAAVGVFFFAIPKGPAPAKPQSSHASSSSSKHGGLRGERNHGKTPEVAPPELGKAKPADGSAHGVHGSISRSQIAAMPMTAPIVAVDDTTFTRADLERAIAQHAVVAGIPPQSLDAPTRDALEAPAYEKLIERHLLGQEAKKRGLWPSDAEVNAEADKLKKTIPPGKTLEEALATMGTDEKGFLIDLASDVAIAKLFEALKKELGPADDAAMRKVYDENKDRFKVPDTAEAAHILVRVAKTAKADEDKAALEKIKAIRKEVAGKDEDTFKKVASEKSEDPSAKVNGGNLGRFARGDMVKEFEDAAFALKKGEISQPIRSDFGWHVIRGGGSQKGSQKTYDEMKPMIAQREEVKMMMDKVDALIAGLRAQAKIVRVKEPVPSPLADENARGSQVPSWKPTGANVKPGAGNPHQPPQPTPRPPPSTSVKPPNHP